MNIKCGVKYLETYEPSKPVNKHSPGKDSLVNKREETKGVIKQLIGSELKLKRNIQNAKAMLEQYKAEQ